MVDKAKTAKAIRQFIPKRAKISSIGGVPLELPNLSGVKKFTEERNLFWSELEDQTGLTGDKSGSFNLTTTGEGGFGGLMPYDSATFDLGSVGLKWRNLILSGDITTLGDITATNLKIDHIAEKTGGHDIVMDNKLNLGTSTNYINFDGLNQKITWNGGDLEISSPTSFRWILMKASGFGMYTSAGGVISIRQIGNDNSAFGFKADPTNNQAKLVTYSLGGNQLIFCNSNGINKNYDHATQDNPTVYIHSQINPDTDNTQWISMTHDQTDGVITSGKGAVRIDSDFYFKGDGTGLPFAEIYARDNTATTSTSTTKAQILIFDTDGQSNNMTSVNAQGHIVVVKAGKYKIDTSISIKNSSGAAHVISVEMYKNNGTVVFNNIHAGRTFSTGSDVGNMTMSGIVDLAANDTIEMWITSDSASARTVTVEDVDFSAIQIGGT